LQAAIAMAAMCAVGLGVLFFVPGFAVRVMSGHAFLGAVPYVFVYGVAMAMLGAVTVVVNYKIGLHRFDFLVPLVAVAILEPVAIAFHHTSLWDVVRIVVAGNCLALITSLYRLTAFGGVLLPRDTPQPSALA
jgi:hypothetical protein